MTLEEFIADRITATDKRNYTRALKEIESAKQKLKELQAQGKQFLFGVCGSPYGNLQREKDRQEYNYSRQLQKAKEKVRRLEGYIARVENIKNLYDPLIHSNK